MGAHSENRNHEQCPPCQIACYNTVRDALNEWQA